MDLPNNPTNIPKAGVPAFVYFCQKVLPAVFDDSLSYYENLCKLTNKINEVITTQNTQVDAIVELQDLYVQLKDYVDNYFTNLDVQNEINNKLDQMATDGTLDNIINQEIFGEINQNISNLQTSVNNINTELENQKKNHTIMLGDSYGVGTTSGGTTTGWCDYLKPLLNLSDEEYFKFVEGGIGFADPGQGGHDNFLELLQSKESEITDKSIIKNIIVAAGYNDFQQKYADILSAISTFMNYCKTTYPNAKVYIGMIGNSSNPTVEGNNIRTSLIINALSAYKNSIRYNAIYLNNVENVLKNYSLISDDYTHPTQTGYQILAENIYQAIITGSCTPLSTNINARMDTSIIQSFGTFRFSSFQQNNICNFSITAGLLTFKNNLTMNSSGYINIGNININNYRGIKANQLVMQVAGSMVNSDNKIYFGTLEFTITRDNKVAIALRLPNSDNTGIINNLSVKSVYFSYGTVNLPASLC